MKIRDWDINLKIRLFGEGMMNITYWMFFPFLTIYFAEEFGKGKVGLLLIFSQLFSVFANLLGGYSADRFGRKRMMVFSSLGQGFFFLLFACANSPWITSPWTAFISYSFIGFFGSLYVPASQAMVVDLVPEKERSHVFAVFYTFLNITIVVGPILGALFYGNYLFELLLISGTICILLSSMLAKWTRETAPIRIMNTKEKWYSFMINQFRDYQIILLDKTFLFYIIGAILIAQTFLQLDLLIPVYIKDVVQNQILFSFADWSFSIQGEQAFGIILSENALLATLFAVVVTRWVTQYQEKYIFILSGIGYAIGIFLIGQTHWIWGLVSAIAFFTLGELMLVGIQQNFISKLAPENMRGQYFAAANLRFTIGRSIAPLSIPLTVWIGYQWTFGIIALSALLASFFFWLMFVVYEKRSYSTAIKKSV